MKKFRHGAEKRSAVRSIALGVCLIWGFFLLFSLIFTVILFSGENPTASTALFSLIAFMIAGALGTIANKRFFASCSINAPLFSAIATVIIYLSISAIISGGIKFGALISTGCFLLIVSLLSLYKKKKAKHRAR